LPPFCASQHCTIPGCDARLAELQALKYRNRFNFRLRKIPGLRWNENSPHPRDRNRHLEVFFGRAFVDAFDRRHVAVVAARTDAHDVLVDQQIIRRVKAPPTVSRAEISFAPRVTGSGTTEGRLRDPVTDSLVTDHLLVHRSVRHLLEHLRFGDYISV